MEKASEKKFKDCGNDTFPYMVVEKDGMHTWHMSLTDARDYAKLSPKSEIFQRRMVNGEVDYQKQ